MQSTNIIPTIEVDQKAVLSRKLMLFDLYRGGHHAGYIQHLVRYWCEQKLPGQLYVVVPFEFDKQHPDIVGGLKESKVENVHILPIEKSEYEVLVERKSPLQRAYRAIQEWKLLWRYVQLTGATHCLLMYLDSFQTPLALGLKAPCLISGIYFRPTFHYQTFQGYTASLKEKIQHYREALVLPRVFSRLQLKQIFSLDPFAVSPIKKIGTAASVVHLPDPVQVYQDYDFEYLSKLKEELDIHPNRKVLLLFGALDSRKGIFQLLDALKQTTPELCNQITLLLVGPINQDCKSNLLLKLTEISKLLPIQVVIRDEFIRDHDIQPFFEISDLVLALYQRHVGMSAILVRAATARKPVFASNYGLMGALIREYKLGLPVDSTRPEAIASGLNQLFTDGLEDLTNDKMGKFAKEHSADLFAKTIFQYCP